jgi:multiple sugar transport system substrate-binding protein
MDSLSRRALLRGTLAAAGGLAAAKLLPSGSGLQKAVLGDQELRTNPNLEAFLAANINWRKYAGTTVTFAASANPWVTAIQPQLSAFEKLTGITINMSVLGEDEFVTKLPITLSSGASTPDIFMIDQLGQAISARWMAPINQFLEDKTLTDTSWYDQADFFPAALAFPTVKGTQWAAPITAEAQLIYARRDLVPKAPPSFPALESAAAAAAKAGSTAGIVMRAVSDPSETPWPLGGFVFSYGGYFIDPDGNPGFTTPEALEAVTVYTTLLSKYGPRGVAGWGWEQSEQAFEGGAAAMFSDSSSFASAILNPSTAKYATQTTLYSLPKHNGIVRPNVWYWTVGINKNSKAANAAWLFLQWATSKPTTLGLAAVTGTATRSSAWASPALAKALGNEAASTIRSTLIGADSQPMALAWTNANWSTIATAVAEGISSIVAGETTVGKAMSQVQKSAVSALKSK